MTPPPPRRAAPSLRWSLPLAVVVGALVARALLPRARIDTLPSRQHAASETDPSPTMPSPPLANADGRSGQLVTRTGEPPSRRPPADRHRHQSVDRQQPGDARAIFSSDPLTRFRTDAQTTRDNVAGLDGGSGTIALWLQPQWAEASHDDATLVEFGDGRLRLAKRGGFLRFETVDRLGRQAGVGTPIADWQPGDWHQVVATWDGRAIALYVDGAQVMTAAEEAPVELPPGTPLFVGSSFPPGRAVAPGVMAGVTIRDRPLTATGVAHRYQSGPRPGT